MKQKRYYSKSFKLKAVELIENSDGIKDAVKKSGIRSDMLGRRRR